MKIHLQNRYGIEIYLESCCINSPISCIDDGNNYKLIRHCEDGSYIRCGFVVENDSRYLEFIDPEGGPFLVKGKEYFGLNDNLKPVKFKILSIYALDSEPGYYFNIKLIEENEQ